MCTASSYLERNGPFKMQAIFYTSNVIVSYNCTSKIISSHQAQQLISNYCLTSLRSSPDTTLSRYNISCIPSYVSLPSCLLNTFRISALKLCWISGSSASSYRAKLIVLPEVSYPPIRNDNACATNKSPSISEKSRTTFCYSNTARYVFLLRASVALFILVFVVLNPLCVGDILVCFCVIVVRS